MPVRRGRGFGPPPETELPQIFEILNRALSSPTGIAVATKHPSALMARLYAARKLDEKYQVLRITNQETEVWIRYR